VVAVDLGSHLMPSAYVEDVGTMIGPTAALEAQESGNQSLIPNQSTETPAPLPWPVIVLGILILVIVLMGR
jgi:hypothetical protein